MHHILQAAPAMLYKINVSRLCIVACTDLPCTKIVHGVIGSTGWLAT